MSAQTFSKEALESIGQILMGAVVADGHVDDSERESIASILSRIAPEENARDIADRVNNFDAAAFDLKASCQSLPSDSVEARRAILDLVVEITNADDVHTSGEDDYIRAVAEALGAESGELAGLVVDFDDIFSDDESDGGDFFS